MARKHLKGFRLHIGLFGRRNVGKSSLLNALTRQQTAIVSNTAGTTTDPVEKPMELQPLGPVLFIDTAGIDDVGALGELRVARTRKVLDRTDLGLIICDAAAWGPFEQSLYEELNLRERPLIAVFTKQDLDPVEPEEQARLEALGLSVLCTSLPPEATADDSTLGHGTVSALRQAILRSAPADWINKPALLADLIQPGKAAVLVVPIDKEAPTGRLILPQQQAIRELLDCDAWSLVVKERELASALDALREDPALVITDSQAFLKVAGDTADHIPMTSFSILFARRQGDLSAFVEGALAIDRLKSGSRVLIAEACSHHPGGEDIARVKIPRWLRQVTGASIECVHTQGHDFPDDLDSYDLVIHCGACMWNRREVLNRLFHCRQAQVPMTNFGLAIAYSLGIFARALRPFPAALALYEQLKTRPVTPIS
jgi:[FeFe] hydrogenase H-cluster maturation GTPase HydF